MNSLHWGNTPLATFGTDLAQVSGRRPERRDRRNDGRPAVKCKQGIVERPLNIETIHHEDFRSHDPDEAHEWLRRTYADHNVKISGNSKDFAFSCDFTRLDGMSFASMVHTMPTEIEVFDGLRDLAIVEHRDGVAAEVTIGPDTFNSRGAECFLLPPSGPYEAAFDSIGVVASTLSFADLQREAALRVDHEEVELDFSRPISPRRVGTGPRPLYVESLLKNSPLLATAPLARRELSWLVNSAVLACFPNSTLDAESASYAGDTPQPLRRALAFIDDHAAEPITLSDIAVASRLSPRGLQAAFRRHLDTTPLAYLRSVRMERAHHDLQSAGPGEGVSVATLAAKWGFAHLGRFAIEYRRRFRVSPSHTLRG